MRREWDPEELIASWTLTNRDWELIANKSGATRGSGSRFWSASSISRPGFPRIPASCRRPRWSMRTRQMVVVTLLFLLLWAWS